MRLKGVEPERIWRTQDRGACAADFPFHPRPSTKLALDACQRLPLRVSDGPKQKRRGGSRVGDKGVTRRQAVNASSGEYAGAGHADATPRALAAMLLIPGGVRARPAQRREVPTDVRDARGSECRCRRGRPRVDRCIRDCRR